MPHPAGSTSDTGDVFVRDLRRSTLRHVQGPTAGYATHSGRPSADARRVVLAVFESGAGQRPRQVVYLRDLRTGRLDLRGENVVSERQAFVTCVR